MILYKRSTIISLANPNCPARGDKANSILPSCAHGMQGSQESTANSVQENQGSLRGIGQTGEAFSRGVKFLSFEFGAFNSSAQEAETGGYL